MPLVSSLNDFLTALKKLNVWEGKSHQGEKSVDLNQSKIQTKTLMIQ